MIIGVARLLKKSRRTCFNADKLASSWIFKTHIFAGPEKKKKLNRKKVDEEDYIDQKMVVETIEELLFCVTQSFVIVCQSNSINGFLCSWPPQKIFYIYCFISCDRVECQVCDSFSLFELNSYFDWKRKQRWLTRNMTGPSYYSVYCHFFCPADGWGLARHTSSNYRELRRWNAADCGGGSGRGRKSEKWVELHSRVKQLFSTRCTRPLPEESAELASLHNREESWHSCCCLHLGLVHLKIMLLRYTDR